MVHARGHFRIDICLGGVQDYSEITHGDAPVGNQFHMWAPRGRLDSVLDFKGENPPPPTNVSGPTELVFSSIRQHFDLGCGLLEDGTPHCWGWGWRSWRTPEGVTFTALATGDDLACGMREDGSVICWGDDWRLKQPQAELRFTSIASGAYHTCGILVDGTLTCWGNNLYGQSTPPRPLNDELAPRTYESVASESFSDIGISGGGDHVCGLRRDGTVVCWTGPDSDYHKLSPPDDESFDSISMGWAHGCGLRRDGSFGCWGQDESMRRQRGQRLAPPLMPPQDERLVQVSSGEYHTCGLRHDGTAVCWGVERVAGEYVPEPHDDETFIAISSGSTHTCALRHDGSPVCWGAPDAGDGSFPFEINFGQASPPEDDRFVAIDAGLYHTCALREDGSAACWGVVGEFGMEYDFGQASPPMDGRFVAIDVGIYHTCALREDGAAVCWGAELGDTLGYERRYEQVGFGQASPPEGERFIAIASGAKHTCGLSPNPPKRWGVRGFLKW